jgi:hypothetical protein
MIHYWLASADVKESTYIPKFYNPEIVENLRQLSSDHHLLRIGDLINGGVLSIATGDEIGKAAYGTGDIPFVRTSDIANWEIKSFPKQGVSSDIYAQYARKQDVKIGDILFVRDGTYLIGNNCFITAIDRDIIYQSHVLKIRVLDESELDPYLLFLALNCSIVQRQIRSFQFTADTIDTIGRRFLDIVLPVPKDKKLAKRLSSEAGSALADRMAGKAFVKHCPSLIESALVSGSSADIERFRTLAPEIAVSEISNRTVTAELGEFSAFWRDSGSVENQIYLPTYYDVAVSSELSKLEANCDLISIGDLQSRGVLQLQTGDEIGKMAYGTGDIAFLRTSDFSNWEINHNPKQGISEEIYQSLALKQDLVERDILLVRDGTYLVGSSCIVTAEDAKSLFCGGLFKIRVTDDKLIDPYLLLGLLNSFIVKRQMRTKQFTRDVIDTLGNRVFEVVLPIPRSPALRDAISASVYEAVQRRIRARKLLSALSNILGASRS